MPIKVTRAPRPARGGEQLSPIEDGFQMYDGDGLCRFEIRDAGQALGALVLTSASPASPYQGTKDYWIWTTGVTAWPDHFEVHFDANLSLPSGSQEIHPQLVFSSVEDTHDLSSSGLAVWRVRQGELIQGAPYFTEVGYLTRGAGGALHWYAASSANPGYFVVPAGEWLEFTRINNTSLEVEAVQAVAGAVP